MKASEYVTLIENKQNNNHDHKSFIKCIKAFNIDLNQTKYIHIAGTNGKGSTLNYLRAILNTAGYKVGTFSSPYLLVHYDRIRINDINISENDFKRILDERYPQMDNAHLSMFEIDTCIALQYFNEQKVDFAIIEVGIGGRLDATNIITPLISCITSIGKDHQAILGNTYQRIAYEKAGIIKERVPCVYNEKRPSCIKEFRKRSTPQYLYKVKPIKAISFTNNKYHFKYRNQTYSLKSLAKYQISNASCAIEVINVLNKIAQLDINPNQINIALNNTQWAGRYEILKPKPLLLLDGAHNVDGVKALIASLPAKNYTVVFSVLADKDYLKMLKLLEKISKRIIVTSFIHQRSLTFDHPLKNNKIVFEKDYLRAIKIALKHNEDVVVTGSLYFISIVRDYFIRNDWD